jgi:DNA-binding NarL/FixJ family response regulator
MTESHGVIVIDDDPFTRTMLRSTLSELNYDVIGDAGTATDAVRLAYEPHVRFAVIDLDLGEGPSGIDVAHAMRKVRPELGVVMVSTYEEPRLLGGKQVPLPQGSIYLVKKSILDSDTLRKALELSVDPMMRSGALVISPQAGRSTLAKLTDLQLDIMRMVASGDSNAEIARKRSITTPSVEKAIARITKQLGLEASPERNQRVLIAQTYHQFTGAVNVRAV